MKLSLGARAASAFLIALLLVAAIEIPAILWPSAALAYSPAAGFVLTVAVIGYVASLYLRRRITKIRISSEGLGIVDSNGRASMQLWTNPTFGLTLMDHSKEARASRAAKRNIELWSTESKRGWVLRIWPLESPRRPDYGVSRSSFKKSEFRKAGREAPIFQPPESDDWNPLPGTTLSEGARYDSREVRIPQTPMRPEGDRAPIIVAERSEGTAAEGRRDLDVGRARPMT
ncbi:MAG: hypothetical protein ABSE66_07320 [Thermoplasmata archaeon]|jgi:hypothetical protein